MTWTLADDPPNLNVRAVINPLTQTDELRALITALEKRLFTATKPHKEEPK